MPIAYVIKKGDRFTSNLTYFTVNCLYSFIFWDYQF